MSYVGRFAPSPTGPLHFGSLLAAVASYLDAKLHRGKWLVRIEDIDTPRCQPESTAEILECLIAHGLIPDDEVVLQSDRLPVYAAYVSELQKDNRAYFCQCTRKMIRQNNGIHDPRCRNSNAQSGSVRFINLDPVASFYDRLMGKVVIDDSSVNDDFIVLRKDGLYAYNLAVVVDDIEQAITHVVRGEDLLETTSAHLSLCAYWGAKAPQYAHIPIAKDENGNKLSKQNHAPRIEISKVMYNLRQVGEFLQFSSQPKHAQSSPQAWLNWATTQWQNKLQAIS